MWRSALRDAARRPVGGDAVASSDVPTSPASRLVVRDTRRDALDALEMHVSVYNLPSALTRRTPRVFVALLVEAPPAAKVPTHRGSRTTGASPGASSTPTRAPRDAPSSLAARHRDWIVAGCTEPVVVPTNARATRFCVPVRVDGLAGPLDRGHLQRLRDKSKKIALALYRVPDADDADDVYVFADENLPKHTRGVLTTTRLDAMEYLGETAVDLGKVLSSIADKSGAAGAVKHSAARDHYALTKNPARDSLKSLSSRLEGDDVVDDARRSATATPPSAPRHKSRLRPTASAPAGLEILAAAPLTHPPLPPKETGRVVVDLLVLFPPPRIDVDKLTAVETHSAYVRLCRWVGDGYQPVYSSLVCGSEEDVAVEPFVSERDGNETETGDDVPGTREKNYRRSSTLVARIPTMHVPIGCLRGGGGSSQEPGSMLPMREPVSKSGSSTSPSASRAKENDTKTFRETHYPLPSPDAAWRLEMVARLADGRDALVGAAELTFGELVAAGVRASLGDGPAALRCDELDARDGADFDVSSPFEKQTRAVFLVERWAVRAGTRARQTWGGLRGQSRFVLDGGNEDTTRASASRAKAPFASRDDDDDDDDAAAALKRLGGGATSAERAGSPSNLSPSAGDKKPPRRSWTPSDSELDSSSDSEREGTPHMMTETKGFLHIARQKGRFTPPRRAKEKVETERKTETIMTPTRARLERARVSLRRREKVPKSPVDDATVAASAAATSRALGLGGRDANANANAATVSPKVLTDSVNTVCHSAAETKFRPDPRLVAAADDAVRSAISDRLQSETRGELIESALRVRRELLKKLSGELRYLEQRARREARVAGGGVWGRHTASSAAARRNKSSVAGTGTMVGRDRT
jgi:hypothetical protein